MNSTNHFPLYIPKIGRVRICLEIIKSLNIKGKIVVNIGCSFGWIERELFDMGARFIGIDPSCEAINFAKKNKKGKVEYLVGDARSILLEDKFADIILLCDVIEHLEKDTELKVLSEINRLLKVDGVLFLSTPNASWIAKLLDPAWYFGHRHYNRQKLTMILSKSEFKVEEHFIKGNCIAALYTIWFYLIKKIGKKIHPRNQLMEKLSDLSYQRDGYIEHFVIAKKLK